MQNPLPEPKKTYPITHPDFRIPVLVNRKRVIATAEDKADPAYLSHFFIDFFRRISYNLGVFEKSRACDYLLSGHETPVTPVMSSRGLDHPQCENACNKFGLYWEVVKPVKPPFRLTLAGMTKLITGAKTYRFVSCSQLNKENPNV